MERRLRQREREGGREHTSMTSAKCLTHEPLLLSALCCLVSSAFWGPPPLPPWNICGLHMCLFFGGGGDDDSYHHLLRKSPASLSLSPLSPRHKVQRASVYLNRRPNERTDGRASPTAFNFYQKRDFEHCYSGVHTPTVRRGGAEAAEGETKFNKRKNEKSWREREGKAAAPTLDERASERGRH